MEQLNHESPAYVSVTENAYAFSEDGDLEFTVTFHQEARAAGHVFIIDIYAAEDHSHPRGHAGWWELPLTGAEKVSVRIVRGDGRLEVFFDGEKPVETWSNPEFSASERLLTLHLVVRAWRSTAILFDDPLRLYPNAEAWEKDAPEQLWRSSDDMPPADMPQRWFVWPEAATVLLVFGSLRSAGSVHFCRQMMMLLAANDIPHEVYAQKYSPEQRCGLKPAVYLQHTAIRSDLVFFVYADGGTLLPLVADLSCKKILYHMHRPDYRRFQAFDAEFARRLEEAEHQTGYLLRFNGICYESEHTRKVVTEQLRQFLQAHVSQMWEEGCSFPPVTSQESIFSIDIRWSKIAAVPLSFHTTPLFCQTPEQQSTSLPRQFCLSLTEPKLPPSLGVIPPSLWHKRWDVIQEEPCAVPAPFILSVGSFRPDKHHEQTMKIFAAVAEMHPSVGLIIAGWPAINGYWDYLRFLREQTYAHIKNRIVLLLGCCSGQLRWLYEKAKVFLTACSYEGYSGSLMDALHFSLPIVARSTFSVRQILNTAGLQYNANMPAERIAEDIQRILNDSTFCEKIVRSQCDESIRHEWRQRVREVLWTLQTTNDSDMDEAGRL